MDLSVNNSARLSTVESGAITLKNKEIKRKKIIKRKPPMIEAVDLSMFREQMTTVSNLPYRSRQVDEKYFGKEVLTAPKIALNTNRNSLQSVKGLPQGTERPHLRRKYLAYLDSRKRSNVNKSISVAPEASKLSNKKQGLGGHSTHVRPRHNLPPIQTKETLMSIYSRIRVNPRCKQQADTKPSNSQEPRRS